MAQVAQPAFDYVTMKSLIRVVEPDIAVFIFVGPEIE